MNAFIGQNSSVLDINKSCALGINRQLLCENYCVAKPWSIDSIYRSMIPVGVGVILVGVGVWWETGVSTTASSLVTTPTYSWVTHLGKLTTKYRTAHL